MSNIKQLQIVGHLPFDAGNNDDLLIAIGQFHLPCSGIKMTWRKSYYLDNEHGGRTAFYMFLLSGSEAVSWGFIDRFKQLVIDAGGYSRNAVWGGILQLAAERAGITGIVLDGYVRDVAELRRSKVPVFARGAVPAGPHKGWGGSICETIQAGGCVVSAGDFIVADDDGVVVVPALRRQKVLRAAQARIEAEKNIIDQLEAGRTTVDILGLK